MDPAARRALVLRRTRVEVPPAVPELRLHLADDVTRTWEDLERELDEGQLPPPFWAFAWVGGQGLARHLLDAPAEVAGRRVLDLATGSGLVALAARLAGATQVLAVDVDPFAETAVALNAELNDLEVAFSGADLLDGPPPDVDVLLAGDVCYDREMTDRVLPWLRAAADRGVRVLLGDPGRQFFPSVQGLPQAGLARLSQVDVPTTRDLEGVTTKRVAVYAVGAPAGAGTTPSPTRSHLA